MIELQRDPIIRKLRPAIREHLEAFEGRARLHVVFRPLPPGREFVAESLYDPNAQEARIMLREGWRDKDVAHEVQHLSLSLVEGFGVLAWRGNQRPLGAEPAMGRIMGYVTDNVVHERLRGLGLHFQREVIDRALLTRLAEAATLLEAGASAEKDGMTRPEQRGHYRLVRACYFIQATLLLERCRMLLDVSALETLDRFCYRFRQKRGAETAYAEEVLVLFGRNDVQCAAGHDQILADWAQLEGLGSCMGVSHFRQLSPGRYTLPYPS